jgi:alkylation response protein AidB-like acyl-CoA dehydrogenase
MDFSESDQLKAVHEAATAIFASVDPAQIRDVEATPDRVDLALRSRLEAAGLTGLAVPEELGGAGLGPVELCGLLECQGRAVAPVPLWSSVAVGPLTVARFGDSSIRSRLLGTGDGMACAIQTSQATRRPSSDVRATPSGAQWQLSGSVSGVFETRTSQWVLVPATCPDGDVRIFVALLSDESVTAIHSTTTARQWQARLVFDATPADLLHDPELGSIPTVWMAQLGLVALSAIQLGVVSQAIVDTAEYTSTRHQFGRPIASFQAVSQRAANCYMDARAMRVTMLQAAWRLGAGLECFREAALAKFWASDAGHRITVNTQVLHGGMGADVSYPIHRYFLWAHDISLRLGSAAYHLSAIGHELAQNALEEAS